MCTKDRKVAWAFASAPSRAARLRIDTGRVLPSGSAADRLARIAASTTATADTDASAWCLSDEAMRFAVYESASHYAPTQISYSYLTFEELSRASEAHAVRSKTGMPPLKN